MDTKQRISVNLSIFQEWLNLGIALDQYEFRFNDHEAGLYDKKTGELQFPARLC